MRASTAGCHRNGKKLNFTSITSFRGLHAAALPQTTSRWFVWAVLHKGAQTTGLDPMTLATVRLFHPRQDRFADHFKWGRHWRMLGRTAIGRATIKALDLNRPRLVAIRRDLASMNRFPPR